MKTISILKPISNHYRKFVENQTLTDVQLNEFIDYFNDQDHLSRIGINGVGILTGFEVSYINKKNAFIRINQGYAITTDGDLLFFLNNVINVKGVDKTPFKVNAIKDFTHFTEYDNRKIYDRFYTDKDRTNMIKLWELTTKKENDQAIALNDFEGDLEDMIVLLYLENYEKSGDGCSVKNCDNQGVEQISNLKVLMISIKDIDALLKDDTLFAKHSWQEFRRQLPDVKLKRVLLNDVNTVKKQSFFKEYLDIIRYNNNIKNLINGYDAIFSKFGKTLISKEIKELFDFKELPVDFQYRYDLLKDLIDTYDEIKDILLNLNLESCPSINAFQKHILLGKVIENANYKTYRHDFYKTPINGHEDDPYKNVLSLIERAENLAKKYKPISRNTSIKITPSSITQALGDRAIPFYYNLDDSFLKTWDFNKTKNLKSKYNLSYHIKSLAQDDFIQNPLAYNIDKNDFFRIEGHQGKHYKDVLEELLELKRQNALSFDIKALSLNLTEKDINLEDYECDFEDLSILLKAWRTEQNSILAEMSQFFSAFSIVDPGANAVAAKSDLEAIKKMKGANATKKLNKEPNEGVRLTGLKNPDFGFKNVVEDNLTIEEGTLGPFIKTAIDQNLTGSPNDIMATYQVAINKSLDVEIWNEEVVDLKQFIITDIVDTLVHSIPLDYYIPNNIREVNFSLLKAYKLTIEKVCQKVKKLQAQYQSKDVKDGSKQILGLMINQLSIVCSSGKKLEILLKEIEKRKKAILAGIQLSNFVESHPGLEHNAGVPVGGTFIIIYAGKKVEKRQLEIISESVKKNALENSHIKELNERNYIKTPNIFEVGRENNFFPEISNKAGLDKMKSIIDNTVIADFYLPYTCCSDCSTTNFVLAKPPVKLRIEKDVFCIGKDTSPIKLQVTPNDGIIKMIPKITGVSIDGNHLIIDKKNILEEDFGKQLKFTVNDQFTDAELRIFKNPVFDFTYKINKSKAPDPTAKEVTITGLVSDASKQPISDVNIVINGSDKETTTDFDGKYTIISHIGDQLIYSQIGMKTESRIVKSGDNIDVVLTERTEESVKELRGSDKLVSVNFTVEGDYLPDGTEFLWDFGDGTLEANRTEENPRHIYSLPVNEENKVNAKLIVTNEVCQKTITHEVMFEEEQPEAMNCIKPTSKEFNGYLTELEALPKMPSFLDGFNKNILIPLNQMLTDFIKDPQNFIKDFKSNLQAEENPYLTIIQAIIDEGNLDILNHEIFKTGTRILLQVLYRLLSCCNLKDVSFNSIIAEGFTNPTYNIFYKLKEKEIKLDEKKLRVFFRSLLNENYFSNYINENIEKIEELLSENA